MYGGRIGSKKLGIVVVVPVHYVPVEIPSLLEPKSRNMDYCGGVSIQCLQDHIVFLEMLHNDVRVDTLGLRVCQSTILLPRESRESSTAEKPHEGLSEMIWSTEAKAGIKFLETPMMRLTDGILLLAGNAHK